MSRQRPLARIFVILTAAGATCLAGGAPGAFRLETAVVPTSQTVALTLDPAADGYTGSTEIALDVRNQVSSFRFHAHALEIEQLTLRSAAEPVSTLHAPVGEDTVEVTTIDPLTTGHYTLSIRFRNDYDTQANGLYKVVLDGTPYLFTQFQDVHARDAFPCWDEPSFKIPYRMVLTVPGGAVALANTLPSKETREGEDRRIEFATTKPLPSYLLAVAVGSFDTVPIAGLSVPGRVVVPKGRGKLAADAVAMTPPILTALERYFGRPYPYDKLDLIAAPEYWYGAMENPGAVVFRDDLLLVEPGRVSRDRLNRIRNVVAHELAHMWFGDLVTMAWWDDLWLNESFANWMASKVMSELFPDAEPDLRQLSAVQSAYGLDSLASARAVRQKVDSQSVLAQAADPLAYQKGEAVIRMVENWLGSEAFRRGVLAYLEAHAWGNASADDLWASIGKTSSRELAKAMATFLDQPGVPVVSVEWPEGGGNLRIRQERYRLAGAPEASKQAWMIPVTLRIGFREGSETKRVLLDRESIEIEVSGDRAPLWVHPNAGEAGYYRWHVPSEMLETLVRVREHLDLRERVGLPIAASAMLASGSIGGSAYLGLLETMSADTHPRVVELVKDGIAGLEPIVDEASRPAFRTYVRRILGPALDRIGLEPLAAEDPSVKRLRPELLQALGDLGRDPGVLALARERASAILDDPKACAPELCGAFLSLAAIEGDGDLFAAYVERFEGATDPTERARYLSALGAFRRPEMVTRALGYTLAGPMRPNELFEIPMGLLGSEETAPTAYAWMKEGYESFASRVPPFVLAFAPYSAAGCDAARLADARTFFSDPAHNVPGTDKTLATVADAVNACVARKRRIGEEVSGYLRAVASRE